MLISTFELLNFLRIGGRSGLSKDQTVAPENTTALQGSLAPKGRTYVFLHLNADLARMRNPADRHLRILLLRSTGGTVEAARW